MNEKTNKMAITPMKSLFWKMGLPMIISMVLQALYNVVDSVFVTNMGADGAIANQALTLAFPIQILIIAVGVGTGVGLNALLSKSLGQKNNEKVNKVAGNGIFLSLCIFLVFFVFGLFGSKWFISLFANGNEKVISMGTIYLKICCCFSLGSIGYTVYERFLQSTGKTMLSTISQISGAITNIVLDYVFIYPLGMGVEGAAIATVIGQYVSLILAMIFHYTLNKEINGSIKYIKPEFKIIKEIYNIGISAAIMQALLSVMMAGVNAILGATSADPVVLVGSFGIYYKIQQIALFSAFGLSNTIISILSFNYGMKDKKRIDECIKYGITDTVIVTLIISLIFEIFAKPLAGLFGLSGTSTQQIIQTCIIALRICSIGYIFMGISVAIQGVLQSLGYAIRPLVISLLRLVIFVFPIAYLFTKSQNVTRLVWWTFPIAEILTSIISIAILKKSYKEKIEVLNENNIDVYGDKNNNLIISIAREHGTGGKEIARNVAKRLNIAFYDKEGIKNYAMDNKMIDKNTKDDELYDMFLSLDAKKDAIIKQAETIRKIAKSESCVIVGRGADYILKDSSKLITVFLYAPIEYRIHKIIDMYNDSYDDAKKHVLDSDKSRAAYYELVTNNEWGKVQNYDLCINCEIGNDKVIDIICDYVNSMK